MSHTLKIRNIQNVTHDVKRIRFEKPEGYSYVPGQATEVAIDKAFLESKIDDFSQAF